MSVPTAEKEFLPPFVFTIFYRRQNLGAADLFEQNLCNNEALLQY
jgi:hypothetical protein